jgi:hypothetical protein
MNRHRLDDDITETGFRAVWCRGLAGSGAPSANARDEDEDEEIDGSSGFGYVELSVVRLVNYRLGKRCWLVAG